MTDPQALREALKNIAALAQLIEMCPPECAVEFSSCATDYPKAIRTLLAFVDESAEALEPFAEGAEHLHPSQPDGGFTLDGIEVRHWRNAYRVHRALTKDASDG